MTEGRVLQVFCTIDSELRARDLGQTLVGARLAACVQVVGPIHSTYRWDGDVRSATEWLLLIKTTAERMDALQERIASEHPYDVPEIVGLPIEAGTPAYLSWVTSSTT